MKRTFSVDDSTLSLGEANVELLLAADDTVDHEGSTQEEDIVDIVSGVDRVNLSTTNGAMLVVLVVLVVLLVRVVVAHGVLMVSLSRVTFVGVSRTVLAIEVPLSGRTQEGSMTSLPLMAVMALHTVIFKKR